MVRGQVTFVVRSALCVEDPDHYLLYLRLAVLLLSCAQAIWEDNQQFWRERNIFDDAYYEFMLSLVSAGSVGEALP